MIRGKKIIASKKLLFNKKIKKLRNKEIVNLWQLGYYEGVKDALEWVLRQEKIKKW